MKYSYNTWAVLSVIVSLVVLAALATYVKNNRTTSTESPTPSVSSFATLLPTEIPSITPVLSPTPTSSEHTHDVSHRDQAKAAYQKGDYTTAIIQYELAITEATSAKDKAELYNLLGNSYRDNKNTAKAIDSYNLAFTNDPNLISAYVNVSNVYVSQNKKDEAKKVLEKGLQANPGNTTLQTELDILRLSGTEASQ